MTTDAPTTYDSRGIAVWTRADGSLEIRANHWGTHHFAFDNPAGRWPCSDLAGNYVSITLAPNGDLVDGLFPDCLSEELAAFIDFATNAERI